MKKFILLFTIVISFSVITSKSKILRQVISIEGDTEGLESNYIIRPQPQACIPKPTCIPRPVCDERVQCRQRPVKLPACEDLSSDTTTEPIKEDIVQITKSELPYCEYRRYCVPTQITPKIDYCEEPPVTITPPIITPPTTVPPKVIKCGLLSICCWEGYNLLPESFWLDKDLIKGRDYIVIGNEGKYLSADKEGKITIKNSVGDSELFRITKVAGSIVHILSYYGGYLTIKEDGSVDAITRTICDDNFIHIIYSKNNCKSDEINYIALRAINGNYLSILENEAASVEKIASTTEIFKGYLFNERQSNCYGKEPELEEEDIKITTDDKIVKDKTDSVNDTKITTDSDLITTITPEKTIIPKECLDLSNKIVSIECKVIMDKINKEALVNLERKRRREY
jgi:hypothetical protein